MISERYLDEPSQRSRQRAQASSGIFLTPAGIIFFFTLTRKVILCPITIVISQALRDNAFDAPSLVSAARVFRIRNLGPVKCTPIRWKEFWLKMPVFRPEMMWPGSRPTLEKKSPLGHAVLGEPTEDGLIQFWSHMSLMSGPRASSSEMVPDEVWQEMPPEP
ncbi:hypothetical protein B0T24DRAFT_712198 [Lasiosphaeria ovina]|uniref:Uncharacterized protein n=1 Tax=Lasiosphaeria ovina TaxID=92902 RepID=A0AAE0JVJ8_9PEZI|nr:hypothetical protein B0T24DRAFT_712198 [Lasiosphaeria ovina]